MSFVVETQVGECRLNNCSGVDGLMLNGKADFLLTSVSYQNIDDFKSTFLKPASIPLGQRNIMIGSAGYENDHNSALVEIIEELQSIVNFPFLTFWLASIFTCGMLLKYLNINTSFLFVWTVIRTLFCQIHYNTPKMSVKSIMLALVIALFFSYSTIFNTVSTNRVSAHIPELIDNLKQLAASGRHPIFSTVTHEYEQFRRAKSGPMLEIWNHRTSFSTVAIRMSNIYDLIHKVLFEKYVFVAPAGTVAFVEVSACRTQILMDDTNAINNLHTSKMPFSSETHAIVIRRQNLANIRFEKELMYRIHKASMRSGSFGIGQVFTKNLMNRPVPGISDADEYRISRCRDNKQFSVQTQDTVEAVSMKYFIKFLLYLYGFVLISWVLLIAEKVSYQFDRERGIRQAWVN